MGTNMSVDHEYVHKNVFLELPSWGSQLWVASLLDCDWAPFSSEIQLKKYKKHCITCRFCLNDCLYQSVKTNELIIQFR